MSAHRDTTPGRPMPMEEEVIDKEVMDEGVEGEVEQKDRTKNRKSGWEGIKDAVMSMLGRTRSGDKGYEMEGMEEAEIEDGKRVEMEDKERKEVEIENRKKAEKESEERKAAEDGSKKDEMKGGSEDEAWEAMVMDNMQDFSWDQAYHCDPVFRMIYKKVTTSGTTDGFKMLEGGMLTFSSSGGSKKICIPKTLLREVLHIAYDTLPGHMGYKKTYDRIAQKYYRPGLSKHVEQYVFKCPKCSINKTSRKLLPGSLQPINMNGDLKAFECVGMDFIVGLLPSNGFDAIMVVIDKFTRYGIFIPMTSDYTVLSSVNLFVEWVVRHRWLPSKFITDRNAKFLSEFWQAVMQALRIRHKLSTAYHAQTDGATERLNQIIEIMLPAYVSPLQDDWSDHIPVLEMAYNSAKNASTGFAPVQLIYTQPHDILERILNSDTINPGNSKRENVQKWLEKSQNRLRDAMEAMQYATKIQKKYYDKCHSGLPPYKVGDFVTLRLDLHPIAIIWHNKLSQQKLPHAE